MSFKVVFATSCFLLIASFIDSARAQSDQAPVTQSLGVTYGAPLTLEMAKKAMREAETVASANKWNVAIAIIDSTGRLVMFQKYDNTLYASAAVAEGKARTALAFRRPTKTLEDAITAGGNGLRYLAVQDITPLEGGIPIINNGQVVGAIGVSGVASRNDEEIARAGADALK